MFRLTRHPSNPVLKPDPNIPWEIEGVFNPGVVRTEDGVIMLYRAVGERDAYISHIGLAESEDGVTFKRYVKPGASLPEPVFGPSTQYDKWATEDPRITQIGDDFYITYVAVPERIMEHDHSIERVLPLETATAVLKTRDFVSFENIGLISPFHSDNKDIVLFSKKMKGGRRAGEYDETEAERGAPRYAMLHRPNRWDKNWFKGDFRSKIEVPLPCSIDELPTLPSIWVAWSEDLKHWTDHQLLLSPSHVGDAKIGPGLPPIETPDGWLLIYHHVEEAVQTGAFIYSTRAALLDLDDPSKIIGKLPYNILFPEAPYETERGTHIVFPTGGFISEGLLHVYYGASDFSIGLATGPIDELLAELKKEGTDGHERHETA